MDAAALQERLRRWRAQEAELRWTGTFWEYFDRVRENPRLARLSHARVYDLIADAGVEEGSDGPRYLFFTDDLFGLERTLSQLVDYFHSAARRLEVRKQILLLMGPVGGGKSTLVTLLKRGLESYSRTPQGALYTIVGCPMHEEPLHLIPGPLRGELAAEYGLYIEGDLCPVCQHRLETAIRRSNFGAAGGMGRGVAGRLGAAACRRGTQITSSPHMRAAPPHCRRREVAHHADRIRPPPRE